MPKILVLSSLLPYVGTSDGEDVHDYISRKILGMYKCGRLSNTWVGLNLA